MKRRNEGKEGGRRGEAHNAMGQGGWTDSICSQLSEALGKAGETRRAKGRREEKWEDRKGRHRTEEVTV